MDCYQNWLNKKTINAILNIFLLSNMEKSQLLVHNCLHYQKQNFSTIWFGLNSTEDNSIVNFGNLECPNQSHT